MKKNVLLLGSSGGVAPHVIQGLEPHYNVRLADLKPRPEGKPASAVDITSYEQVLEAARGVDAILNFTVNRPDPEHSFHVNTLGAWHVMKAAAELGIRKIIHTGPQLVIEAHNHNFDMADTPPVPGTDYYTFTKFLSMEICKIYAQAFRIQTICFLFASLGPRPETEGADKDFPPFYLVWEDLQHACRLALEIESVPGHFQALRNRA